VAAWPETSLLQAWAGSLWGGPTTPAAEPVGAQFPPPIPGAGTTRFDYVVSTDLQSWGVDGWSVPREDPVYPGGGVLLAARPELGVMRIFAWWPDATLLHLVRVHPDGSRHAVRGGTPRRVPGPTRRNHDQNPSGEVGTHGLFPGAGDPVLRQVPREPDDVSGGGRYAIANDLGEAGPSGLSRPIDPMEVAKGAATVSFDALFSAQPSSVTVSVEWVDAAGDPTPPSTATLTADDLVRSVGLWGRQHAHLTAPGDAATAVDVDVTATGLPAGPSFIHDRWVLEQGHTDGSFIGGSVPGGQWLGVPELSASLVADVQVVDDGECPLDVPVRYELFYAGITTGLMRSLPDVLASPRSHYGAWLTHPRWPDRPIPLWIPRDPAVSRPIERSTSKVMGRRRKVVRSDDQRSGDEGTLIVYTEGQAAGTAFSQALDDGRSLLVRLPAGFQHPPLWWLSFDVVERSNPRGDGPYPRREWSLPFTEVDAPNAIDTTAVA
jgi:hypothetical protein